MIRHFGIYAYASGACIGIAAARTISIPPQRLAGQRAMTKEVLVMAQLLTVRQVAGQLGVSRRGDSYWLKFATRDQASRALQALQEVKRQ